MNLDCNKSVKTVYKINEFLNSKTIKYLSVMWSYFKIYRVGGKVLVYNYIGFDSLKPSSVKVNSWIHIKLPMCSPLSFIVERVTGLRKFLQSHLTVGK